MAYEINWFTTTSSGISFISGATANDGGTSGTSVVQSLPGGTQSGDLVLWVAHIDNTTAGILTWPAGWTNIAEQPISSADEAQLRISYRILDGSEGPSATATLSATDWWASSMVAVRGATAVDVSTSGIVTAHPSPWTAPSLSVTTSVANTLLIYAAGVDNVSSQSVTQSAPSGWTERTQTSTQNWANIIVSTLPQVSAGSTGTVTGGVTTGTGNVGTMAILLALK